MGYEWRKEKKRDHVQKKSEDDWELCKWFGFDTVKILKL